MSTAFRTTIGVVIGLVVLLLGVVIIAGVPTFTKADGGTVIVVRNGGWLDDNSFQEVVQPNSALSFTGFSQQEHPYPASQRFFKVGSGGDTYETINVPTSDGVDVGVEGTWYFELTTDPAKLQAFDDEFGTRTFAAPADPNTRYYPWDGDVGWSVFLDSQLSTVAVNTAREALSATKCQELVASCALIRGGVNTSQVTDADPKTFSSIQTEMATSFERKANALLGDGVLTNVSFNLSKVNLPSDVQAKINEAFSKITAANGQAQADVDAAKGRANAAEEAVRQAKAEAEANRVRQEGYNSCSACAEIDKLKAIPPGVTVWAPGSDTSLAIGAN